MKRVFLFLSMPIFLLGGTKDSLARSAAEFLTDEEIELVQITQKINSRVDVYLRAAALRLDSAEARILGEETEPEDPLEYLTPEDMLDGYYRIIDSVMLNLENTYNKTKIVEGDLRKALKDLRTHTKKSLRKLEFLEEIAKEQDRKELLRLIHRAIDITNGAHEGAAHALKKKEEGSGQ